MPIQRRSLLKLLCAAPIVGLPLRPALADNYPSRPIRLFVPFGPGSGSDVYARHFGKLLGERIGQAVVVENRPGAGGAVAVQAMINAPADGYTVLLGSNSPMAVNVSSFKNLAYDPLRDVEPISGLTRSMALIVVPNESELRSVQDLVQRGKKSPRLNMGTYSSGYQLGVARFLQQADFRWQDVPYKGLSQTTTDLIGRQIDVAVIDSPGTVQMVRSGQIRALAVTGSERHPELPEVPTLVESGYPDAVHYSWTSLWVRTGTPAPIVERLAADMLAILADPQAQAFVESTSGEIMPLPPARMREFQRREIERFAEAVRITGFQPV